MGLRAWLPGKLRNHRDGEAVEKQTTENKKKSRSSAEPRTVNLLEISRWFSEFRVASCTCDHVWIWRSSRGLLPLAFVQMCPRFPMSGLSKPQRWCHRLKLKRWNMYLGFSHLSPLCRSSLVRLLVSSDAQSLLWDGLLDPQCRAPD